MGKRAVKFTAVALAVCLIAGLALSALFPAFSVRGEQVVCRFPEGDRMLSLEEAAARLEGVDERGDLLLEPGGTVFTGEAFGEALAVFRRGDLTELLGYRAERLSSLERIALFRLYGQTVYYSDGAFRLTGDRVAENETAYADRVVLLGSLPRGYLAEVKAKTLVAKETAVLSASDLIGSEISDFEAFAPYHVQDKCLYLTTDGGVRLVTSATDTKEISVADCDFIDRGALLPAKDVTSLDLPYVGSSRYPLQSAYNASFLWLFQTEDEAPMPESLRFVRVRGGMIESYAFTGVSLDALDLCTVKEAAISSYALTGGRFAAVHAPRDDLILSYPHTCRTLGCGCTLYETIESTEDV